MVRKEKCGSLETSLCSCLSSSMSRPVDEGCQLSSGVCKRKSCLRAQIFGRARPNTFSSCKLLLGCRTHPNLISQSEAQLPEPPRVPRTLPLTMTLQKARSLLPYLPHVCFQVISRLCLLIPPVVQSKAKCTVPPVCFPWTLLPRLSAAACPAPTASITGKFLLSL